MPLLEVHLRGITTDGMRRIRDFGKHWVLAFDDNTGKQWMQQVTYKGERGVILHYDETEYKVVKEL